MTCYQNYTVTSATNYILEISIEVEIYWYGDLGGFVGGMVNMPVNTSCNTTSVYTAGAISCWGENVSNSTITYFPASSGTQNYIIGTYYPIGMSPC